mmetsp:Transcript_26338/g.62661  ORF Transcript_26338/g.62661 Transcript_26338/m.62661 type:complete len:482 (-) Transcript_26338:144-1589(-)
MKRYLQQYKANKNLIYNMKINYGNFLSFSLVSVSFYGNTVDAANLRGGNNSDPGTSSGTGREVGCTAAPCSEPMPFGDILLFYTDQFELLYNNQGSGANMDGAFYRPLCAPGYLPLGDIGLSDYNNPNGDTVAPCVASIKDPSSPPLANPTTYTSIYSDQGTGAHMDGSTWRPVPPSGYSCLGDVFQTGYDMLSTDIIYCVRSDLTYYGTVGDLIWNDHGSGGDHDLSVFQMTNYQQVYDDAQILLGVNTLYAEGNYEDITGQSVPGKNLILPLTVTKNTSAEKPALNSTNEAPAFTTTVASWSTIVPFAIINDSGMTLSQQISSSQFYTLTRKDTYIPQLYLDNSSDACPQQTSKSVTAGVSTTDSQTFSEQIGISIGYSVGVSAFGFSQKTSINLSATMGFSETTSVTQMQQTTLDIPLHAPAYWAAEVWSMTSSLQVSRGDGNTVSSTNFDQNNDSYVYSTYCVDQTTGTGTTSTWLA